MATNNSTQNQSTNENINRTSSQNQQNQSNTTSQSTANTSQSGNKASWLLSMPGTQQLVQRVTQEMNNVSVPQYQLAGLSDSQKAALATLQQGRDDSQLRQILGAYQQQAQGFTNYGSQQDQINKLAQGYYQSDLVNQNKQALEQDINRQLSGQVNQLNQQSIGSGNMASSRAGIAQGVMERGAQENYAKGAADIENSARTSAYNTAYSQYQQGQSNLFSSLGAQATQAQNLANWGQQDAQTTYNAGQQLRTAQQQQYDLQRQNQIIGQSQGLQALNMYLPSLSSLAEFGVNTSATGSQTSTNKGSGTESINTSGTTTGSGSSTTNNTGSQSGDTPVNWGGLAAGLGGELAGNILQPVASSLGNAISPGGGGIGNWLSQIF